jgi:hypothetical protein
MKYVISAIVYAVMISIIVGGVEILLGKNFIDGFFPTGEFAWTRWLVRGAFVTYMTIKRPINGI